jgi:hypothetical protein
MLDIIIFIIIIFIISFISDIVLRIISPDYIKELLPYFEHKTIIEGGLYAGITIVIATIIMIHINKLIFGKFLPISLKEIVIFMIMAFVVGWIIDVIIMKADIFGPSLRPFYEKYGAGFWGAGSFVFALFITFGLKHLCHVNIKN